MKIKPKEIQQITDFEGMPKPKVARGHTQKKAVQVHKNKRAYSRKKERPFEEVTENEAVTAIAF